MRPTRWVTRTSPSPGRDRPPRAHLPRALIAQRVEAATLLLGLLADLPQPLTCATVAEFLDGTLAVIITRSDDDKQIRRYAEMITGEVTR